MQPGMFPEMAVRAAWILVGPTAAGKSDVAHALAVRMQAAILSADALLVYRGMDIGTAKPDQAMRTEVPYCGIDLVRPDENFDLWTYLRLIREQLEAFPPEMPLIVVGGSGLYVKALLGGVSEMLPGPDQREHWNALFAREGVAGLQNVLREMAPGALLNLADPQNPRRLIRAIELAIGGHAVGTRPVPAGDMDTLVAGLLVDPAMLRERIAERVDHMYAAGLLEEVRHLRERFPAWSCTARQAIGYAEALDVLAGRCGVAEAKRRTVTRTNQLAKRQRTWFRHQIRVAWVPVERDNATDVLAEQVAAVWRENGSIQLRA
jgi:tRNA dimethylallyltransferase